MSNPDKRWPYLQALKIATEIKAALSPYCERIEIAGSIRRRKRDVGDIEIIYVPRFEMRKSGFFDHEPFNLAGEKINSLLTGGYFSRRPNVKGGTSWGEMNKLAIHMPSGIATDLFSTTLENWWVTLAIRTGGKTTNLKLTNGALSKGMHLNAYGSGFTMQNGKSIPATSERSVFEIAGVPWQEPEERE